MNEKKVPPRDSAGSYPRMLAIIIGIGDYPFYPPKLFYTMDDAVDIADILVNNFGFHILQNEPLIDPSKDEIKGILKQIKYGTNHEDAVLIFYSGHGENQNGMGYIIPSDGQQDNSDTWISAKDLLSTLIASPASNIFVIFDMCYSGVFLNIETFINSYFISQQGKSDNKKSPGKKTISLLVAGTSEQEVPEVSHFSHFVKKGLMGYAGNHDDGEISSWEIMDYVKTEMEPISGQKVLGDYLLLDEKSGDELVFQWQVPFIPAKVLRDLESESPEARISAVHKLGIEPLQDRFKDVYFQKIKEIINTDVNIAVCHEAIKAVSKLNHPKSLDYLLHLLNKYEPEAYKDKNIKPTISTITTAIENLNSIDAIIPLLDYLSNPNFDKVTSFSIRHHTLSRLIGLVSPEHETIINNIVALLNQKDFIFKETLIRYLRRIGGRNSAAGLFQFFSNPKNDYELRRQALFFLPAIGDDEIIQTLEAWVKTEGDTALGYYGKEVIEDLKRRFGIINWEEKDMLFDFGIVVPDFPAPYYLENALEKEGCSRLSALVDLVVNDQEIPVGDRQLSAISLLANESGDCDRNKLINNIQKLEECAFSERNESIIKWVNEALILFKNELDNK